jgi:hypothetical protein
MVGTKESGLEEMMHWWENVHLCIGSAKTSERALRAGAAWIFARLRKSIPHWLGA